MKRKKKFFAVSLLILIAVAAGYIYIKYMKTDTGLKAEVITVSKGEIKQYVEDTATVKSTNRQTIYVEGNGKATGIKAKVGDFIKKGDILLTIDKSDLELQLMDANAKIEAAEYQLQSTDPENNVKKIEIAEAAIDQAKVNYDASKRNFETEKTLYNSKVISKEEYDKAEDSYKAAEVAVKTANLQLEDIKSGTPDYVKNQYNSQIKQAIISRDAVMQKLQKQQVMAQSDGIVLEKLVDENVPVTQGTAAFVIGNTENLELEANILSDDIYKIKLDQEVEVSGKPMGNATLKGKVTKIAPEAKTITSSLGVNQKRVPVTIELIGDTNILKPGYDLDIKIIVDAKVDTVIVPDSAVFDYKGKSSVFVIDKDIAAIKPVTKGIESDKNIEVTEGLEAGVKILTKPDNDIKEGMKIKAVETK